MIRYNTNPLSIKYNTILI